MNKFKIKSIPSLLVQTYNEMLDDKGFKMAAALSYYAAFSLGPLLIIVIAIAGFVFGEDAARGQIFDQMKGLIGPDGAIMLETIVKGAADKSTGIFATVFSVILLVLGSLGVFVELQESLNIIWGVEPRPGRGIWGFIKTRITSFSMVAATGFLLMVSLIINSLIVLFNNYLGSSFPAIAPIAAVLNSVASFVVTTLLFGLIYRVLPDVKISWRYVWLGALLTSALFVVGKYLIGLYLGSSSYASTYGAAASLVVLFLWIYYSGLILFFGAELTQVVRKRYSGTKLEADADGIIVPKVSDLVKSAIENNSKPVYKSRKDVRDESGRNKQGKEYNPREKSARYKYVKNKHVKNNSHVDKLTGNNAGSSNSANRDENVNGLKDENKSGNFNKNRRKPRYKKPYNKKPNVNDVNAKDINAKETNAKEPNKNEPGRDETKG